MDVVVVSNLPHKKGTKYWDQCNSSLISKTKCSNFTKFYIMLPVAQSSFDNNAICILPVCGRHYVFT